MRVLVGSTVAPWKADGASELAWLDGAEVMVEDARDAGHDVSFFCAIEQDARGDAPFGALLGRLEALGGVVWRFGLDDNAEEITSGNRLIRICTGRNLVIGYMQRDLSFSHVLFLDSDIYFPKETVRLLLALQRPVSGLAVGVYCLDGPRVKDEELAPLGLAGVDVREHWNTAGCLMVERRVLNRVRWGMDHDAGLTDDPTFQRDTVAAGFGETWVRHDVVARHCGGMVAVEDRAADRRVWR